VQQNGHGDDLGGPEVDRPYQIAQRRVGDDVDNTGMRLRGMRMIELCQVDAGDEEDRETGQGDAAQGVGEPVGVLRDAVSKTLQAEPLPKPIPDRRIAAWFGCH